MSSRPVMVLINVLFPTPVAPITAIITSASISDPIVRISSSEGVRSISLSLTPHWPFLNGSLRVANIPMRLLTVTTHELAA